MTTHGYLTCIGSLLLSLAVTLPAWGQTTASSQLAQIETLAQVKGDAAQGKVFFSAKHANQWSCTSCHGTPPVSDGEHASTGKRIAPLAPAFNPEAFTRQRHTDKWFRRNCKDVLDRACTEQEKANVLAFLLSLKN